MVRMFREFWENRKLIWKLSKNDFKTRYAGSYFGVVWAMVQPGDCVGVLVCVSDWAK